MHFSNLGMMISRNKRDNNEYSLERVERMGERDGWEDVGIKDGLFIILLTFILPIKNKVNALNLLLKRCQKIKKKVVQKFHHVKIILNLSANKSQGILQIEYRHCDNSY